MNNQSRLDHLSDIAKQLREGRLSRSGLAASLTALGLSLGAALVLDIGGAQASTPDSAVLLKSTNPALSSVIQSGPEVPTSTASTPGEQIAYHRYYRARRFRVPEYRRN